MDMSNPMIQEAVKKIQGSKKSSFPWERDIPYPQPYYTYSTESKKWEAQKRPSAPAASEPIKSITIYSWNIEFMWPYPNERMATALTHLASMIFPRPPPSTSEPSTLSQISSLVLPTPSVSPPSIPTILLFNELLASDLALLQSSPWVQTHFHLTDLTPQRWESGHYGTATLIDRRIPLSSVFRVHYSATKMERDGLFVDLSLAPNMKLRICNTHLESLIADPPLRPHQLRLAAEHMHASGVDAAILGGDLNAIQPFDATMHVAPEIDLQDAHLELNKITPSGEDPCTDRLGEKGDTWGFTAPTRLRRMFGTTRMDKLLFCGKVKVKAFERFGWDVVIEGEKGEDLCQVAGLERAWVTDHLGIRGEFEILDA